MSDTPLSPALSLKEEGESHQDHIARGVVYGCLAVFLLTIMGAFAKQLSLTHNVVEIVFYRNIIAIIPITGVLLASRKTHLFKADKPFLLFLRVVIGFFALAIMFESYALLPLADATVIIMSAALFAPAIAHFTLKERAGRHRWAAIVIGLIGVAVMARPSGHVALLGALAAFTTAFLQGFTQVLLRSLRSENSFTVTFYFILGGAGISGLLMPFIGHWPAPSDLPLIIGIGISGSLGQFFLTSAFRSAPASVVAPLNYAGLVWASLLDIIFWKHIPNITIYVGAAIIIASQAYILHREKTERRRQAY